jgi:hypothetical protein
MAKTQQNNSSMQSPANPNDKAAKHLENVIRPMLLTLKFSVIRDRENRITEALTKTFEWVYQEDIPGAGRCDWSPFGTWLQSNTGLYWIAGKPESGKSTLLKYLHSDSRTVKFLKN